MRHEPGDPGDTHDELEFLQIVQGFAEQPTHTTNENATPAPPPEPKPAEPTGHVLALTVLEARAVMSALSSEMVRESRSAKPDRDYIQRLATVVHKIAGTPPG